MTICRCMGSSQKSNPPVQSTHRSISAAMRIQRCVPFSADLQRVATGGHGFKSRDTSGLDTIAEFWQVVKVAVEFVG